MLDTCSQSWSILRTKIPSTKLHVRWAFSIHLPTSALLSEKYAAPFERVGQKG